MGLVPQGKPYTILINMYILNHYDSTEGLPNWPDYPGEKTFTGTLLHGKNVRDALDYKDKVVLVLGASYSGADLIFEIAPLASKVYLTL